MHEMRERNCFADGVTSAKILADLGKNMRQRSF